MILNVCPNPSIDTFAWFNDFNINRSNRITKIEEFPGGKGTHIALALAELGEKPKLLGNWAGNTGEWIKNACVKRNIDVGGVQIEGNNRKCYTFRSSQNDLRNTEILEPGPEMSIENWSTFKKLFEIEISKANVVCLSGSWPKKAPKDAYLQLIQIAKKQDKKVFLDCSGVQLTNALRSSFFALHLNEQEAFEYCGSDDFNVLLKKLDHKIDLIALTKGREGLYMRYKQKTYFANVEIEGARSTVGSGDCLTAGLAWAFEKGLTAEQIASYGVACGAANCLHEELGMLKKKDVNDLLPKVKCKVLENES